MSRLLHDLLGIVKVAIISGGDWPQFEKQVLSHLPHDGSLVNLSILPTCGTKLYQYKGDWKKLYSEDFSADEKAKIISSLKKAVAQAGFKVEKVWGEVIEDRGSQITFSALGQQAPLEEKKKWDPDFTKRKKIKAILDPLIPGFSVRMGGATSIDVTKPGIDKAYGIGKLRDVLGISLKEMIFIGDALFPGGNDYPAEQAGVVSIPVRGPHETKRVIETIIACLSDHGQEALKIMSGFKLRRLGMIMEPEPGNPQEIEGVLNPAAVRGPDGELYLFPRMVAKGNYSRIGIARVRFNAAGDPTGVERLGIALEPEADYELRPNGGGGCEDPRVTFVEPLQRYLMTYTAFSAQGPRIALALSEDLFHWKRLGRATFGPYQGIEFDDVDDKDASLFPVAIPNPSGHPEMAILHRPLFPALVRRKPPAVPRPATWISIGKASGFPTVRWRWMAVSRIASASSPLITGWLLPVSPWERLKIGGGTPPILTRHGWLIVYHGVSEMEQAGKGTHPLCYSAGVMVLSKEHPQIIRYRSAEPVLTPLLPQERDGTVANVVFPTGIDRRDDIGSPDRFDIYYGMADNRIGVARLDVPGFLPPGGVADPPEAKV